MIAFCVRLVDNLWVGFESQPCMESISIECIFQAWKSLIVVSGSPYRIDTTDFADQVRKYNSRPPFKFPSVMFPNAQVDIHISIYAAHLYDSVILYAKVSETE